MKIPERIAAIIDKIGVRELSFSEKRELINWYRQLNEYRGPHLPEEEADAIEKRIFNNIQDYIDHKFQEKKCYPQQQKGRCFSWLKRLLYFCITLQNLNSYLLAEKFRT